MPDTNHMGPEVTSSAGEEVFSSPVIETAAPGAEETAPAEALELWLNEPGAGGISCGGWAGLGLLAGLLLAGVAAAVPAWLRRRKKAPPVPDPDPRWTGAVTVEKLHEQGARPGQQDCFFVSTAEETAGGCCTSSTGSTFTATSCMSAM